MQLRKGFTLIELIIVISVIGVLGTEGYKQFSKVMMEAKAQKIASSLKMIKKSIADTLGQAGGYYQSTGAESTKTASPQPVGAPVPGTTCGSDASSIPSNITMEYLSSGSATKDTSCYGQRIENALHHNLVSIGIKWDGTTKDFRLPSAPLAHISFPFEVNGVRAIRVWGIQGDLAFSVLSTLNGTHSFTNQDGWVSSKPVAIAKFTTPSADSGAKYGAGTEKGCLDSLSTLDTPEKAFDCIVNGTSGSSKLYGPGPGTVKAEKNAPKVVLYYTYAFGYDTNDTNDS